MLRALDRSLGYRGVLPSLQSCAFWLAFLPQFPLLGLLYSPVVICLGGPAFCSAYNVFFQNQVSGNTQSRAEFEPEDAGFEVFSVITNDSLPGPQELTLTQLAQGRSAWELPEEEDVPDLEGDGDQAVASPSQNSQGTQQRFNRRGYPMNPESRAFGRTSRRAQNDVLSTVGICVGVHEDGRPADTSLNLRKASRQEVERLDSIRKENETGLLLSAASHGLVFLGIWGVMGLRNRLQTFSVYAGHPLTYIFKFERAHFGLLKLFIAGCPSLMACVLLGTGRELVQQYFSRLRMSPQGQAGEHHQIVRLLFRGVEKVLHIAGFLLIAPFEIFSFLQVLGLIPAKPLFPRPRALMPFSSYSPLIFPALPTSLDAMSLLNFTISVMHSPVVLLWVYHSVCRRTEQVLYAYLRRTLPKPENPDIYSVKAARLDDYDAETILGLESSSNDQESVKFIAYLPIDFRRMGRWLKGVFGLDTECESVERVDPTVLENDTDQQTARREGQNESLSRNAEESEASVASPSPSSSETLEQLPGDTDTQTDINVAVNTNEAGRTREPSLPAAEQDTISSSSEGLSPSPSPNPVVNPAPVRVSNRRRDTDTVTMEVEISGRPPNVQLHGRPVFTSTNPSAIMPTATEPTTQDQPLTHHNHRQSDPKESKHRVTVLSGYMADTLASYLATHITKFLCLPMEALLVRTIALSYIAVAQPIRPARTAVHSLTHMVYPPNAWFGLGLRAAGWRGVADYAAKMVLCSALEGLVGYGVWQVGAMCCFWIGGKWFRWGRL